MVYLPDYREIGLLFHSSGMIVVFSQKLPGGPVSQWFGYSAPM